MKTILNEKLIKDICGYLKEGVPILTSCQAVGISESIYYDWIKRGQGLHTERTQEEIHVKFVEEVEKAVAASEVNLLRDIIKDKSWHAKAWVLERRFPERWSKKSALEKGQNSMTLYEMVNHILEQFSSVSTERLQEIANSRVYNHDID
jgi:hypothetical protein